jgi:hypothetical protein
VLHLLALPAVRAGVGVGKVFEFAGPVVRALSTDERATLTNMTAELGGFTGIVAPDEETVRFLRERRGVAFEVEPWMRSDPGATYADLIRVDCSALSPMVARPGDPGNSVPLADIDDRVSVDIAYGGSCTAGKREEFDRYHEVLSWAAGRACACRPASSCTCSSARRRFATTASPRLPRRLRARRRAHPAAVVRRLRELRAGLVDRERAGDRQRDQPQLSRALGAGPGLAREPADRGRERDRRAGWLRSKSCANVRRRSDLTSPVTHRRQTMNDTC